MKEQTKIGGLIRVHEVPFEHEHECAYWWYRQPGEQSARMSAREKERYRVLEVANLLTGSGQSQLMTYIAQATGTPVLFAQQFSVGTGAISQVQSSDSSIAGELVRVVPGSTAIVSLTQTVSLFFTGATGAGTWTNAGFWGDGTATSTLGTGTLYTHALLSYVKDSSTSVTVDYVFSFVFS